MWTPILLTCLVLYIASMALLGHAAGKLGWSSKKLFVVTGIATLLWFTGSAIFIFG